MNFFSLKIQTMKKKRNHSERVLERLNQKKKELAKKDLQKKTYFRWKKKVFFLEERIQVERVFFYDC